MGKKIIGAVVLVAVTIIGLYGMFIGNPTTVPISSEENLNTTPKTSQYIVHAGNESFRPREWGLTDPESANNLTWKSLGNVEIVSTTLRNAPQFYGELESELLKIGYSMIMGNWSNTSCQWSLWKSSNSERSYYIAYYGQKFIGIRGPYNYVVKTASEHWLCENPSHKRAIVTSSPQTSARGLSLKLEDILHQNNITTISQPWVGPLPDWYLGKFSFKIEAGNGVEVLVLTYTTREQAEYAIYLLKKAEGDLEILRSYGGQYYSIIVLKGNKNDVALVVKLIQSQ